MASVTGIVCEVGVPTNEIVTFPEYVPAASPFVAAPTPIDCAPLPEADDSVIQGALGVAVHAPSIHP